MDLVSFFCFPEYFADVEISENNIDRDLPLLTVTVTEDRYQFLFGNSLKREVPRDTIFCPISNSLTELYISDNVGSHIFHTEFSHLYHLVTLSIGKDCFTDAKRNTQSCVTQEEKRSKIITNSKTLIISHCPNLASINIGKGSFQDAYRFDLLELPRLESLTIGEVEDDNNTWASQSMCFVFSLFMEIKSNSIARV